MTVEITFVRSIQSTLVEDADVTEIKEELKLAQKVLQGVGDIEAGNLKNKEVLAAFKEARKRAVLHTCSLSLLQE